MKRVMPCEVYSRVVGYYRPLHNWNVGKKQEFHERVEFTEEHSLKNPKAEVQVAPLVGGGSEIIDAYKIFTFPHCDKCEEVKEFLKDKPVKGHIIDLKTTEGNKEFRNHYSDRSIKEQIKRMEDGTLKLPIVMFMSQGKVVSTAQSLDETKSILA